MRTVAEIERAIETLSPKDFRLLAAWVEKRAEELRPEKEVPAVRDHSAFLKSYAAEDEGLYDDAAAR
jgi:hypothetical protein